MFLRERSLRTTRAIGLEHMDKPPNLAPLAARPCHMQVGHASCRGRKAKATTHTATCLAALPPGMRKDHFLTVFAKGAQHRVQAPPMLCADARLKYHLHLNVGGGGGRNGAKVGRGWGGVRRGVCAGCGSSDLKMPFFGLVSWTAPVQPSGKVLPRQDGD